MASWQLLLFIASLGFQILMMMCSFVDMCVPQGQWCWCGDDCVQEGELNPSRALQLSAFPVWTEPGFGENGLTEWAIMPVVLILP